MTHQQLLEDYQRRLKEAISNKKILMQSFSGITGKANTKYNTTILCFRTIISELEKVIEDTPDLPGMEEKPMFDSNKLMEVYNFYINKTHGDETGQHFFNYLLSLKMDIPLDEQDIINNYTN